MLAPPRLFIGSSTEGNKVARYLQAELQAARVCEVELWNQAFDPSRYALESLLEVARRVDFAVLVASPDDVTISRDVETASVRDNIVLEFGLFAGALGRERTYLLATGDAKLPTDVLGLTRLAFHPQSDGSLPAALAAAVLQIERQVDKLGRVARIGGKDRPTRSAIEEEMALLSVNARAQGWTVKETATALRLRTPKGKPFTLVKHQPQQTRADLRAFAALLRCAGLRVNSAVWRPVEESPYH